jgi:hypothetical protein
MYKKLSVGKRPLGRPRFRWEDNIKMDLTEIECGDEDWIHLAQEGFQVGSCEHDNEHLSSTKGGEFTDLLSNYQVLKKYCLMELTAASLTI